MKTLKLYGYLADTFGSEIQLAAETPREVVTALAYQDRRYREYLLENDWVVFRENEVLKEESLDILLSSGDVVHLHPVIGGEAIGAVVAGLAASTGAVAVTSVAWTVALSLAGGLLMGYGIGKMVRDQMKGMNTDPKDSNASFIFNGVENVDGQGGPIQLGYGRMLIGSTVISVGLDTEQVKV